MQVPPSQVPAVWTTPLFELIKPISISSGFFVVTVETVGTELPPEFFAGMAAFGSKIGKDPPVLPFDTPKPVQLAGPEVVEHLMFPENVPDATAYHSETLAVVETAEKVLNTKVRPVAVGALQWREPAPAMLMPQPKIITSGLEVVVKATEQNPMFIVHFPEPSRARELVAWTVFIESLPVEKQAAKTMKNIRAAVSFFMEGQSILLLEGLRAILRR